MVFTTQILIGVLLGAGVVSRLDVVVWPWQRPRVGARARLRLETDLCQLAQRFQFDRAVQL